jgi:hypothetical protein
MRVIPPRDAALWARERIRVPLPAASTTTWRSPIRRLVYPCKATVELTVADGSTADSARGRFERVAKSVVIAKCIEIGSCLASPILRIKGNCLL